MSMHSLNIVAGLIAGTLCALGDALKDSPYEGFKPLTFTRSIWVGLFAGAITSSFTENFYVAICCSGYMERCAVEGWKILRQKKPGRFDYGSLGPQ